MLHEILEAVTELITGGAWHDHHQGDMEMARSHSILYQERTLKMLRRWLTDELREGTTIVGRNPAEEAWYRQRRPLFTPETSLPWPPVYPPAPLKYDFYADRYNDESISPSLSYASEQSNLGNWNARVSAAEPQAVLCDPAHLQSDPDFSPRFGFRSQLKAASPPPRIIPHIIGEDDPFNPFSYDLVFANKGLRTIDHPNEKIFAPVPPKAPSPPPRIIPHIIGEDDPFNPFSYDLVFTNQDGRPMDHPNEKIFPPVPIKAASPPPKIIPHIIGEDDPFNPFAYDVVFDDGDVRTIDHPNGKIYAPIPTVSTAAALANFEAIALAATAPSLKASVEKEPSSIMDDSSKESRFEASVLHPIEQSTSEHDAALYHTGPYPQVKSVANMIGLLSMVPGPHKDEKMKQLWNGQGALGDPFRNLTDNRLYEALKPVPPQPLVSYPTDRMHLALA